MSNSALLPPLATTPMNHNNSNANKDASDGDAMTASFSSISSAFSSNTTGMLSPPNRNNEKGFSVCAAAGRCSTRFGGTKLSRRQPTKEYHTPPPGVDYNNNPTVFGRILRGEASAIVLGETPRVLAFEDIAPRAPLHALVIPKLLVRSVLDLTPADLDLLHEMKAVAMGLLRSPFQHNNNGTTNDTPKRNHNHRHKNSNSNKGNGDDFMLCFHVPPYNSVNHLHLHVLAPASRMSAWARWVKYNPRLPPLAVSIDTVIARLEAGRSPVPYRMRRPHFGTAGRCAATAGVV